MDADAEKRAARVAMVRALKTGTLPPVQTLPCAVPGCESGANVYHHDRGYDADHQTDVVALCGSHHKQVHLGKIPDPRTGRMWPRVYRRHGGDGPVPYLVVLAVLDGRIPARSKVPERWEWAKRYVADRPGWARGALMASCPLGWASLGLARPRPANGTPLVGAR